MLKRDISKALLRFKTEQVTGCTMYLKTTNESLQENVIPNRKCKKIWLKCSIKTEQYCLLFCNILILWHRWSLQTTLCCHLRTHKPSGFWKGPSLLPELVLPLSTQLRVLNNLLHDELEGDPTPPHPHSSSYTCRMNLFKGTLLPALKLSHTIMRGFNLEA